jgi:hypothetical protein
MVLVRVVVALCVVYGSEVYLMMCFSGISTITRVFDVGVDND